MADNWGGPMSRAASGNIARQFGGKTPDEIDAESAAAAEAQKQAFATKLAALQAMKDQQAPAVQAPAMAAPPVMDNEEERYQRNAAALKKIYNL